MFDQRVFFFAKTSSNLISSRSMRESIRSSKDSTPVEEKAVFGDRIEDCPPLTRLESHESALDAFFANLPQGAPHIKVQRISK